MAKEPVSGATIRIFPGEESTVADDQGRFYLTVNEEAVYQIEIRSIGYKTLIQNISIESEAHYDFVLEESMLDLNQVVVTGTMKPVFVTNSPVKVDVITAKHFNTYLPAASSGIMEGIALINGVEEVVSCGVCFTNSISINGLPGTYTAVLLDGTPIYGNLAAVYGLNGIPSVIIDRIEVIKGPNSTLYGSEAVAGVINIITKDPTKEPFCSFDLMGTSHLESFGNLAIAPSVGKSSGYIGLNYAYINSYEDDNNDGFNDMINTDQVSLFTKWDINRPSGKAWSVAAKYYYEDRRNGVEAYLNNRNYKKIRGSSEIYGESIYTNRVEMFGNYEIVSNLLKLNYSISNHHQNSFYGNDLYEANQFIAFGNFIYSNTFKKHAITSGLTLRYQDYDDNTVATERVVNNRAVNQPEKQFIPGIFLQDEYEVHKDFTLLGGLRVDSYFRHGLITSPSFSVKVNPGEWTTLRLNTATGFKIVSLFTEDHAFISGQRTIEIKEKLDPERSYNVALNLNHVFTLGNSQGMIDMNAFYTHFKNKIIPDYSEVGKIIYANTEGYAVTRGIGINVTQELSIPLSFNLGLNYQKVYEVSGNNKSDIPFAPQWSSMFNTNYEWKKKGLVIAFSMNVTGKMHLPLIYDLDKNGVPMSVPRPEYSSPFSIYNLQATKGIGKTGSIYVGIQNILNYKQYYSPLSGYNDPNQPPGFSSYFDTSYAYSPIHGREFYVGVSYKM